MMGALQLIVRADDLGYSEAINYGIEKTVKEGLVRSVGLMPNMPSAVHGLRLMDGTDACIGMHTNLCVGRPCADPRLVPSLLDGNGDLKSSRAYREAWARGEEFTSLDEMVTEIEAQYERFTQLVGKEPAYFEGHAIMSDNLCKGLEIVAARHGLRYSALTPRETGSFCGKPMAMCAMGSMKREYDPRACLKEAVAAARRDMPNVFVCHPGYLDEFILKSSSLTINRTKEVTMLTDPAIREWLVEQRVELISYADI